MSEHFIDDLRGFICAAQEIDGWRQIDGVDWDLELYAVTEAAAELIANPPLLIFDNIKDYLPGYRVAALLVASSKRAALALGLPIDRPQMELVRMAARKWLDARPIPPVEVPTGPVMENVLVGDAVDLWRFPTPHYTAGCGGRYIGTGDTVINRDPDTGYVNMGTYRIQIHEGNLLGIWMSPGQQGILICERYWARGESCPVVATFGQEPLMFMASRNKIAWGLSELDYLGGLRGRPVEVIKGPLTGLPIPARAEIAIEGEIPPPQVESRAEGPFVEWPGYYAGGTLGSGEPQPVIRVRAIYHRDNPILVNEASLWLGALKDAVPLQAGILWDQLEKAGVQDIVGVNVWTDYLAVVAIRQRYVGHARQTGLAAAGCAAIARHGRYIVVVDDDIDPTDLKEVLWAMETRVDPATDILVVDGCWSTPLDPRIPPDKRASGDYTNSRAIFFAVRPWAWRERFPKVSRSDRALRQRVLDKYRSTLPFPR